MIYSEIFILCIHDMGEIWVLSYLGEPEKDDTGCVKALGYIQYLLNQNKIGDRYASDIRTNNLFYQMKSISQTLLYFMQSQDMSGIINKILNDILLVFGRGRTYIIEYDWESEVQCCTYEVASDGVSSEKDNLQNLSLNATVWWTTQLTTFKPIIQRNIDFLPDEASEEKEILAAQDIKSIMAVPMQYGNKVWGYMGIDIVDEYRDWSNEDYQWFSVLANVVSICIKMRKSEEEARRKQQSLEETCTALDYSEKTLRQIYQNIPVGIEVYDKDGYLIELNDRELDMFGLKSKESVLGVNIFDNPILPDDLKQKLRKGQNIDFELNYDFKKLGGYYLSKKRETMNLVTKVSVISDQNNNLVNYLLINIDNTDTTSAHKKIQDFEDLFSVIAQFANVGFFLWNPLTKDGFAINQWFENLDEPEKSNLEDVIGVYRTLHPDDRTIMQDFYQKAIDGEKTFIKQEVRVQHRDGTWKWIRCCIMVKTYQPEINVIELIGVNYDITELKETQMKRDKAEELDRLKSAFLANMSHEIRTPLNAIVGFSGLLAEAETADERQEYVDIIRTNNEMLLQLISDVLDLSKIESGMMEFRYSEVDLHEFFAELTTSLRIKMPEGVALCILPDLPSYTLECDRVRVSQVLTNFVNNAVKYTTEGSITLAYRLGDSAIEFSVTDTGTGISKEMQGKIFERFVKGNSFRQGTGLGLAICKSIVEGLGGEIGVKSEEGKGARFWFTLPLNPIKSK